MAAVSTMILRSMRMIGEKSRGATLDANEQVECLAELNSMMESWSNDRLNCYTVQTTTHALTASSNSYSVGVNGTISGIGRPLKIVDPCFVRDANGYDTGVQVVDREAYAGIVSKSAGYTVPTVLFYDADFSATSTATLYLYPSPSASLTLHFSAWKQMQNFANLSTQVLFPPGYQLAIESNFAIHLAAGLIPVSPELAKIARESKAAIMGLNNPSPVMSMDLGMVYGRRSSIFTGTVR